MASDERMSYHLGIQGFVGAIDCTAVIRRIKKTF